MREVCEELKLLYVESGCLMKKDDTPNLELLAVVAKVKTAS